MSVLSQSPHLAVIQEVGGGAGQGTARLETVPALASEPQEVADPGIPTTERNTVRGLGAQSRPSLADAGDLHGCLSFHGVDELVNGVRMGLGIARGTGFGLAPRDHGAVLIGTVVPIGRGVDDHGVFGTQRLREIHQSGRPSQRLQALGCSAEDFGHVIRPRSRRVDHRAGGDLLSSRGHCPCPVVRGVRGGDPGPGEQLNTGPLGPFPVPPHQRRGVGAHGCLVNGRCAVALRVSRQLRAVLEEFLARQGAQPRDGHRGDVVGGSRNHERTGPGERHGSGVRRFQKPGDRQAGQFEHRLGTVARDQLLGRSGRRVVRQALLRLEQEDPFTRPAALRELRGQGQSGSSTTDE